MRISGVRAGGSGSQLDALHGQVHLGFLPAGYPADSEARCASLASDLAGAVEANLARYTAKSAECSYRQGFHRRRRGAALQSELLAAVEVKDVGGAPPVAAAE